MAKSHVSITVWKTERSCHYTTLYHCICHHEHYEEFTLWRRWLFPRFSFLRVILWKEIETIFPCVPIGYRNIWHMRDTENSPPNYSSLPDFFSSRARGKYSARTFISHLIRARRAKGISTASSATFSWDFWQRMKSGTWQNNIFFYGVILANGDGKVSTLNSNTKKCTMVFVIKITWDKGESNDVSYGKWLNPKPGIVLYTI